MSPTLSAKVRAGISLDRNTGPNPVGRAFIGKNLFFEN
jgi:hypothetical protein